MAQPLITSRDSKGLQAARLFEAVYDKAELDEERAQRLNEHPELATRLRNVIDELSAPKPRTLPPVDEPFDLEVNGDVDSMSVVTSAGYNAEGWRFLGPAFPGKRIYRVRLVDLGYCANRDDAARKAKVLNPKYRLLEGQAREPFKAVYPRHNGRPVVFGGNEWQHPSGRRRVAYLDGLDGGGWRSDFDWSGLDFGGLCLWAVVEQDA